MRDGIGRVAGVRAWAVKAVVFVPGAAHAVAQLPEADCHRGDKTQAQGPFMTTSGT